MFSEEDVPMDTVEYELCDVSGEVFKIRVAKREAMLLDYDSTRRFRLLKLLKSQKVPADHRWDESVVVASSAQASSDLTLALPAALYTDLSDGNAPTKDLIPPPQASSSPCVVRAQGKKGAKWDAGSTTAFLAECRKVRVDLRVRIVEDSVWQGISNSLFESTMNYSAAQLREKMRNLKRTFSDAKRGLHGGQNWRYYADFVYIYDAPVRAGIHVEDICEMGLEHFDSLQASQMDGADNSSSSAQDAIKVISDDCTAEFGNFKVTTAVNQSGSFAASFFRSLHNDADKSKLDCGLSSFETGHPSSNESPLIELDCSYFNDDPSHVQEVCEKGQSSVLDLETDCNGNYEEQGFHASDIEPSILSPSRKIRKGHSTIWNASKKTPTKSPRRKLAADAEMVWPINVSQMFLAECLLRKNKLQKEQVPLATWKEIAGAMGTKGHPKSWEVCRAKYANILEFFVGTLLHSHGVVGGIKCHFYDPMCQIHDIPEGYELPPARKSNGNAKWCDESTRLLLDLFKWKQPCFKGTESHLRHDLLFKEIAEAMVNFNHIFTGPQCKGHYNFLKGRFMEEYDACKKTGAAPSSWEWYGVMEKLYEGTATLEPPVAFASGTTNQYSKNGTASDNRTSGSRTRPPCNDQNNAKGSKDKTLKKPTYRNQALELEATKVQQRADYLNEMKLMRQSYAENCTQQNSILQLLLQKQLDPKK